MINPLKAIFTTALSVLVVSCTVSTDPTESAKLVINSFAGYEYPVDLSLSLGKETGCVM